MHEVDQGKAVDRLAARLPERFLCIARKMEDAQDEYSRVICLIINSVLPISE